MNDSKDKKLELNNANEVSSSKKSSLPLIFGTGAIIFAGVISCDVNVTNQIFTVLNNHVSIYEEEESQNSADAQASDTNRKKSSKRFNAYVRNKAGEMFYDSDAEDDEAYYGDWDLDDYDDEEDFILW
jgi:hypothetical protein